MKLKILLLAALTAILSLGAVEIHLAHKENQPMVVKDICKLARKNDYWKVAFLTGEYEQIVFMSVSPKTNPNNEIGMEKHPFDQAILIVDGKGEVELNGKTSEVKKEDLIFIPKGTEHNVINLEHKKPLKLISFYSANDIPIGTVYTTKTEEEAQKE